MAVACGGAPDVSEHDQPFATLPSGEPVHEEVTAAGLWFLRTEVVRQLQALNVVADGQFFFDNRYHFDDCNFSGASEIVATEQADAVANLGPTSDPVASDLAAMNAFARSLHTTQDFYAHTNWVELGFEGLVNSSLSAWPTLLPYSMLAPSGVVVVQGRPTRGMGLMRNHGAAYPLNAVVFVQLKQELKRGLISGSVDYEPGDFCPAQVAMTHDELNKDRSTTTERLAQHLQAKELATQQTRHEWCRLLSMTRSAHGDAGDQRLFAWVNDVAAASACGDAADLSVSVLGAAPDPAASGEPVSIDIQFDNAGPATAYGTAVAIELGAGLSASAAVSRSAACSVSGPQSIDCYVGELASGGSGAIVVTATANAEGTRQVDASIRAHVSDSNAENNSASLTVGSAL
jgi:hypothetical protein